MAAQMFNPDMDQRLTDISQALASGGAISARFEAAYQHGNSVQPDRLVVDIAGTPRQMSFAVPVGASLADQLEINGHGDAAGVIRAAIPET